MALTGFNFTEAVRRVLAGAREESRRLGHEYVGTEHLLLALTRLESGPVMTVVERAGSNMTSIRASVESIVRPGVTRRSDSELPYTSRAKKVLELTMEEARAMGANYIDCEHLLLGLLAEDKGIAAQVLVAAGVTLDDTRATVMQVLGVPGAPSSGALTPIRRRVPVARYAAMGVMALTWMVVCITVPIVISVLEALFSGQPSVTVGLGWISWRNPVFVACLISPLLVWLGFGIVRRWRHG